MKNVLVVYYTQSGQLKEIAQNIANQMLHDPEINVTFHEIKPVTPFPFPWKSDSFFDVFPESFLQIPVPLIPISENILETKFDLILLHYQVWYLSPSIPVNSFLKSDEAATLFKDTPVVTISGSRNMWIMAQEKMKVLLKKNKAILKGNIALVDRVPNLISVVTIVEWMFSGKKSKYLGIFPLPGVSNVDISESKKYGLIISEKLKNGSLDSLQSELIKNKAVNISSYLTLVDKTGTKIFTKWSNFILNRKNTRKNWLKVFYVYLFLALWVISPIVYILHILTYPFKANRIRRQTLYYQGV